MLCVFNMAIWRLNIRKVKTFTGVDRRKVQCNIFYPREILHCARGNGARHDLDLMEASCHCVRFLTAQCNANKSARSKFVCFNLFGI